MEFIPKRVSQVVVRNLLISNTGTYNNQQVRPYMSNVNENDINTIINMMGQHNATITSQQIAGRVSNFIAPTANSLGNVNIVNGWDNQRCRFLLEVDVSYVVGQVIKYYFQGFTDFLGVTNNGSIAPDMVFYINAINSVANVVTRTPTGPSSSNFSRDNMQVISGNTNGYGGENYMLRPSDVFTHISMENRMNTADVNMIRDTRSLVTSNTVNSSNRNNNIPSNFVSSVLNTYILQNKNDDFGNPVSEVFDRSVSATMEMPISENPFIALISTGMFGTNTFTFGNLVDIDRNTPQVTTVSLGSTGVTGLHHVGQTASWHSSDRETIAATVLANSVPAIALDSMITNVYFKATNHAIGGVINFVIVDLNSPNKGDITREIELFKHRVITEVINDITFGNQDSFQLDMSIDIFGETYISISLSGAPAMEYVAPTFADSLYSPVVSNTVNSLQNMSMGFGLMFELVDDLTSPSNHSYGMHHF
jgi:hypothetical protein